ncbi:galactose-1-phosphate uridylyltransferase [Spirillospora sp. CA-294931]|uniref:galactose-1-phosphate uridylyltransferase n=1 Tax=Spirillospora sp. CA-294931 TaxID=3240042 RepID=UPI003D90DD39
MTIAASHPGRTSLRLADGRELIYFDDVSGLDRSTPDPRPLPPRDPRPELRHDPVYDEWIAVAAHRQTRTFLPAPDACPLCPGGPDSEIPAPGYHVVSFENRFPSLGGPAGGRCEVVCFTDDHDSSFARLPADRLPTVARAFADRTRELGALPGVQEVFVFENRGTEIGATLQHPHGQIYAFPYLTPKTDRLLRVAERGCAFCAAAAREAEDERVVGRTEHFVAFVPRAARWPYQVHIVPFAHVPDLPALDDARAAELMGLYADVLGRFERLFPDPAPYMACWHQAPVSTGRDLAHLWIEVFSPRRAADKLKYLASVESGAGAFITDVLPETAAARLRDA